MLSMRGIGLPTEMTCPACQEGRLHIKVGKNGEYLACNRYPQCSFTRNYTRDGKGRVHPVEPQEDTVTDQVCDKCGRPMVLKEGRYGPFLACSGYPDCKQTASLNGPQSGIPTGVGCPAEGCGGELVERKSRRGKVFYGCNRFPECDYATWDRPVPIACPNCGGAFLVERSTKKEGKFLACADRQCGYRQRGD